MKRYYLSVDGTLKAIAVKTSVIGDQFVSGHGRGHRSNVATCQRSKVVNCSTF